MVPIDSEFYREHPEQKNLDQPEIYGRPVSKSHDPKGEGMLEV